MMELSSFYFWLFVFFREGLGAWDCGLLGRLLCVDVVFALGLDVQSLGLSSGFLSWGCRICQV